MTDSQIDTLISPRQRAKYELRVVSFNVQHLLAARGKSQESLGAYLGMKGSGISLKISRANWKFDEVFLAAEYLNSTPNELADDTVMRMLMGNDAADRILRGENEKTAAGDSRPRFLVAPAAGLEPATVRLTVGCSAN